MGEDFSLNLNGKDYLIKKKDVKDDRDRQVCFVCFALCALYRFASCPSCRQLSGRSAQGQRIELPDVPRARREQSSDAHDRNLHDVPSKGRTCEKDRKGQTHQSACFSALRQGLGVHELPYGSYGTRKFLQSVPPV